MAARDRLAKASLNWWKMARAVAWNRFVIVRRRHATLLSLAVCIVVTMKTEEMHNRCLFTLRHILCTRLAALLINNG